MASTYSPNLRLELIGTGDQQGTWGITTNTNLGTLLEQAIGGYETVTVSNSGDTTLTANNGSADQSRNMVLNLTGTISAARTVICPAIEKLYVVKNATTGGFDVTFKVSGQTGVTIPNGSTYFLYVDGTDARLINGTISSQNANNVSITGGSLSGVTVSNTSLSDVSVVANASSLSVRDADGSHVLSIAAGSNLTANRVLTLTTGDAARTLDISAANVTVSTAGANLIDDADASAQRTTLGLGTIATQNANNVSVTGGSITGITDIALADGGTGASLSDPGANAVLGWNDTANVMRFFTAGAGIEINATSNTIIATSVSPTANTQTFNTSGTWTKPTGDYSMYMVQVWGAGGSGGHGRSGGDPGGGGGGGGYAMFAGPISHLSNTETVTVGLGGAAVTAATTAGNAGGSSSFTRTNATTITVYGGGGGGASFTTSGGGGGGGSIIAVGGTASANTGGAVGGVDAGIGANSGGVGGAGGNGGQGSTGGGGGGGGGEGGGVGGKSIYGGGGGGGGAYDNAPGAGAGGVSIFGGNGGDGSFDANNATAGTQPGGGGGGSEIGNSGKGGDGRVIVTVW